MINNFAAIREKALALGAGGIAVAGADDPQVLESISSASQLGLGSGLLVGDAGRIRDVADKHHISLKGMEILDHPTPNQASLAACDLVRSGRARILMKGQVKTGILLKAVLDKEHGLGTGSLLSHILLVEHPALPHPVMVTDGGMVPQPGIVEKAGIIRNAVLACRALGIERPRVALLSDSSRPDPDRPSAVHGALLSRQAQAGMLPHCEVLGNMPLDQAIECRAHIWVVPQIEAGNFMGKALMYFSPVKTGMIIAGARAPVVVTSRVDSAEVRLCSIALALVVQAGMEAEPSEPGAVG